MKRTSDEQLADIAQEFVHQNKSKRRWRLVFGLLFIGYFAFISYIGISESGVLDGALKKESPFVAEVVLTGTIQSSGTIDADEAIKLLHSAFESENAKAVILRINSPGGSPVQSSRIYKAIVRFKKQFDKKIYVVIEDICASGCYYIASSADEIYADESSIIGSIGVVISGFGAVDAIEKLGIKRRLYTAGKYKGLLDSFSPENEKMMAHIQSNILNKSHQNFINAVKVGRGDKLSKHQDLFTGLIWLGEDAKKLGLIDGIADSNYIAKHIIGVDSRILFEKEKTLLEQLTEASAKSIALVIGEQLTSQNFTGALQ
ncbi:Periplasmic serine proteases (ClpP class) [Bathymodiolus heckerae thiotrophic gill symbiont]|uniref:S49 family peptidase n=1 Tax=Bathymodiolus heckerae thiotrophic gill symbiont TaxID=1052212 RepID=UPI0010BAB52C|nr:S49 family peptidase [Bathymodiolus heckerae thiotrophic gill symbiont]SMN12757.1 Periplasmic serine proteases (ClpP class) [Bathymodiolus heckerae thiotrophic gill symbiont]